MSRKFTPLTELKKVFYDTDKNEISVDLVANSSHIKRYWYCKIHNYNWFMSPAISRGCRQCAQEKLNKNYDLFKKNMGWDLIDTEEKKCGCIIETYDHDTWFKDHRHKYIYCDKCLEKNTALGAKINAEIKEKNDAKNKLQNEINEKKKRNINLILSTEHKSYTPIKNFYKKANESGLGMSNKWQFDNFYWKYTDGKNYSKFSRKWKWEENGNGILLMKKIKNRWYCSKEKLEIADLYILNKFV